MFYEKIGTSQMKFDGLNITSLEELGRSLDLGHPTMQGRARFGEFGLWSELTWEAS